MGEGGYQVGNFPPLWAEWNGKYRDCVRDFWRGEEQGAGRGRLPADGLGGPLRVERAAALRQHQLRHRATTASRCAISSPTTRSTTRPTATETRDGDSHNRSWNRGVEGPTDDPRAALRDRQMRNFLATLLLAQGIPMLLAGDELGRTQGGNNNAYCQDNEISWIDWSHVNRSCWTS